MLISAQEARELFPLMSLDGVEGALYLSSDGSARAPILAEALAQKIIANAPLAVKYTMEAIERGVEMPQEEGLFLEATLFGLSCATEDMREGMQAFIEKRKAEFQGR